LKKELSDFIAAATHIYDESVPVIWGNISLQLKCYLSNKQPPQDYVSSARAIVFHESSVLVVTDRFGERYILPGGRVEADEIPLETLNRELLEETGWTLLKPLLFGFIHFHHLGPEPDNYRYPYPDFIWQIYLAEANNYIAQAMQPDYYVKNSHFEPIDGVKKLPLGEGSLLLFDAALKQRES